MVIESSPALQFHHRICKILDPMNLKNLNVHGSMESFYFALSLGMMDPAMNRQDILIH